MAVRFRPSSLCVLAIVFIATALAESSATSTSSVTSTSATSVTITSTFTPERWSEIRCTIGLIFFDNVTTEEVENVTRTTLAEYLDTPVSLVVIESIEPVDSVDVSGQVDSIDINTRLLSNALPTWNYQIVYKVLIPGLNVTAEEELLSALYKNNTLIDSTIEDLIRSLGLGNYTTFYATEPDVILWLYTTVTVTSTTCCVCNLPAASDVPVGVPVGLAGDLVNQTSNESDLIRIECMGFKWFDTCNPVCGPGYVEAEHMICTNRSEEDKMDPSTFSGAARCERNVCPGSPFNGAVPTGYAEPDPNCTDMLYQDRCNILCSSGYTDEGTPVQQECQATSVWPDGGPVVYEFAEDSGRCTEMFCDADSVPDMSDVIDSSSCVGTASRANCSPVCDVSYDLVEPINCTKGQFDEIPLVCVPSEHAEALELVEVLLIRMAIASDDPVSVTGLTTDWAANPSSEAAIKSAIGSILGLLPGQIFVKGKKELNSDWSSVTPMTTRRLTTLQGLFCEVVLQPTERVSFSALNESISGLAGNNFTDELTDALQDAGVSLPSGLTVVVGPTEYVSFTLPVARWVARTDWSLCDNTCGVGVHTRTVECVGAWGSNATDLCNANAGPGFTMESYLPDTESCEQYISCPYDWTCPSGPDPVTGEGCEGQASGVAIALAAGFLCLCCLLAAYLRTRCRKRPEDKKTNLEWTREEPTTGNAHPSRRGCATLTPKSGRGDPIGPVDLDLSGAAEFELQMRVTTTAKDSLLLGKVYRHGDATSKGNGKAKALVIRQGFLVWQVGEDAIHGKTYIADGEQHEISISYVGGDDQYVLMVDGIEEARGLHGVADNLDTSLVLGTASAPKDDAFNALYPLFEELHRAGVEVSPLEDRAEEPLFDGDIDGLIWREYQWSQEYGHMAWFAYDLHIGAEGAAGERTAGRPQLFHMGQSVEYWSKTIQTWMPAQILDVSDPCYDDTLKLYAPSFNVHVEAASQTALGVGIMDLRAPFDEGESVSVFSQKHGSWFPARVHGSRHASDPRRGYDIKLEDVVEAYSRDGEETDTYVKSELQKDLARYKGMSGHDDDEPLLKNMTAKRLRRRFNRGERVLLYQGTSEGFVEAEVVQEEAQHKPGMESVVVALGVQHDGPPSHSPSPERETFAGAAPAARGNSPGGRSVSPPAGTMSSLKTSDDTQRTARRYNFSDQRHADVVVRRIRSGSKEAIMVPEYALRRLVGSGGTDAPPRQSSHSGREAPRRLSDRSSHAESAFEL